eukprot:CAMPEP_0114351716 /NCGR_PEP_ID=MMETSP0101-20121206/17412_1 /TAXON_ID=38822 ORGANISM="Pteridomonas danica, Strain PT" /NCGR_SAMPLE_ID=MMETSP0101 /ASSEMBLY_ACC=CAM_ASM_000211 /LENGTH=716 /DNA_ID=CAMNT_0001491771 /DNA_START=37 /DNA_END=2184 /DNA_ORIENTATION=-
MSNNEEAENSSCFTALKDTARSIYESKYLQFAICLATITLAIVSIVTASIAFTSFDAATDNLNGLISNWERAPVTGVYLSNTTTCPSGYTRMDRPKWPGTYSDACACPSGAYSSISGDYEYSSASDNCDSNQTDAGCVSQPSIASVTLKEWRGRTICLKREGKPQLINEKSMRPIPKKAGVCDSGYQACGSGTYDKKRTVCFPEGYDCPVTGAMTGTSLPSDYTNDYTMYTDDGTNWYFRIEAENEMPINHIELVLYNPNSKRGHCFLGGGNEEEYYSSSSSYYYTNSYPAKCSKLDTRWETLDYQTETDYLQENFDNEDSCQDDTDIADYIATGTKCGTYPNTDTDCMMYGASSSSISCSSTDSVCLNINYQSNCGALTRWANQNDQYWAVQFRREIYWKSDCDSSMTDIKAIQEPIDSIQQALGWNMGFSITGNVIGAIFAIAIYHVKTQPQSSTKVSTFLCCFHGHDKAEYATKMENTNKKISLALCFIKFIPTMVAIGFFGRVAGVIKRAAEGDCSDSDDKLTQTTFTSLHSELNESIDSLYSQIFFDSLNIFVALVLAIMAHVHHHHNGPEDDQPNDMKNDEGSIVELGTMDNDNASPVEVEDEKATASEWATPSQQDEEPNQDVELSSTGNPLVHYSDEDDDKTMMDVIIPDGLKSGDCFMVSTQSDGQEQPTLFSVTVPEGFEGGNTIRIMSPKAHVNNEDDIDASNPH